MQPQIHNTSVYGKGYQTGYSLHGYSLVSFLSCFRLSNEDRRKIVKHGAKNRHSAFKKRLNL